MSRKNRDYTREVLPDPKYGDIAIAKAVSVLMKHGKKSTVERALYEALSDVEGKTSQDPVEVFHKAIDNIRPMVEVRSRRVGGATYQVPTEVSGRRGQALALRWLKTAASSRNERRLAERLSGEILDAFHNRGAAVKKREDTHKMADANKAFAHFRW